MYDPPSQPPYKTIWKPKKNLKIFVLGLEKLPKISKKFDTYSYKLHTGGDNVSDKKDLFSFSGLFHNLDTGNYLYATSYGSSEHFQSLLIFHTGFKSILEICTQWDEMRSCDLQDSSVS